MKHSALRFLDKQFNNIRIQEIINQSTFNNLRDVFSQLEKEGFLAIPLRLNRVKDLLKKLVFIQNWDRPFKLKKRVSSAFTVFTVPGVIEK